MLQITICDDNKSTIGNLENLLRTYAAERFLELNITYFLSPSALYAYMCNHTVDIIFMDLEFGSKQEDGILWSTKIHQEFPQSLVLILTAYENRYREGYIAKAFRFMTKPFSQAELYENMNACLDELNLYLVNLNAIESIKNHSILLTNGEKLSVSRRKWTLLKSAYMKFDITMKGRNPYT